MSKSNKCIQLYTKSDIKTNKPAIKNEKKNTMLLNSNPHRLSAKTLDYPLDYRGIVINFIQISNLYNNLKHNFYEDSRRLRYSYVSGQF